MTYAAKQFAQNTSGDIGVTLSVQKDQARGIRFSIRIRSQTQQELGWNVGERFSPARGKGDDAGKLKIYRDDRGYTAAKESGVLRIYFPAWKELPAVTHPSQHCEFVIEDGTLILTLPDWS